MSEQIEIRRATFKDLPQVIGVLAKVGLPIEGVTEHIKHFFIAENYGDLVGVSGIQVLSNAGLLRSTAVVSGFRNKGVGKMLVDASLKHAKELGLNDLYLLTTAKKNYFAKLGFSEVKQDVIPESVQNTLEYRELCIGADCMRISFLR